MKLSYNVWTTSRGSHGRPTPGGNNRTMTDPDASEPLLNSSHSSNIVTDYYAQTRSALKPGSGNGGGCGDGGGGWAPTGAAGSHLGKDPTRTICSPQHPSQDLIEMLNRNQQVSLIRAQAKCHREKQQDKSRAVHIHKTQIETNGVYRLSEECQRLLESNMQNVELAERKQELSPNTFIQEEDEVLLIETLDDEKSEDSEGIRYAQGNKMKLTPASQRAAASDNSKFPDHDSRDALTNDSMTRADGSETYNNERKSLLD